MAQKPKTVHVAAYRVPARVVPAHDRGMPSQHSGKKKRC